MWTDPTLIDWQQASVGELRGDSCVINKISTDSRTIEPGDIYVALIGPQFDGHKYVTSAVEKGAKAVVVELFHDVDVPQLKVPDTTRALGELAGVLRSRFTGQVVALTGSAGKTTTRAMLAKIFSFQPGLLVTDGNFNNFIGVPKTWFRITDRHQRVLLELGANAQREIAWMTEFSKPHISLLLNAAEAHTEGFGGIEGVRLGKGEIIDGTDNEGGCVLNRDDPAFNQWLKRAGDRRVISFGRRSNADVSLLRFENRIDGSDFEIGLPDGDISVSWSMLGVHMAENAAAAAAVAWLAGVSALDIAQGLSEMKPEPGRLEPLPSRHGGALIHDAYNANPFSFRAAIDVLAELGDDTLLIAGDMAELGEDSISMHQEVGEYANGKIKRVWTIGVESKHISEGADGTHFRSLTELVGALLKQLTSETAVLVKGSRSAGLERVVQALRGNH